MRRKKLASCIMSSFWKNILRPSIAISLPATTAGWWWPLPKVGHFTVSLYAVSGWFILNMGKLKETQINTLRQKKIKLSKCLWKDFVGLQRLLRNQSSLTDGVLSILSYTSKLYFILSIKLNCYNTFCKPSVTQSQLIINQINDSGDLNAFPTTSIRDLQGHNRTRGEE